MNIGTTLRDARRRKHLTLEDISRQTKITVKVLRAIESNRFEQVPGGIFTRGFLRAYAGAVGEDPEAIVERYQSQCEPETAMEPPPVDRTAGMADTIERANRWMTETLPVVSSALRMPRVGSALLIALVAMAYVAVSDTTSRPGEVEPIVGEPLAESSGGEAESTVAPLSGGLQRVAIGTSGDALQVDLRVQGPCWVAAVADGKRVVYRLLQAGEQETIMVHEGLTLRVGDPGQLAFSVNGASARPLGRARQPVTVHITTDNYRDFLETQLPAI